MIKEFHEELMDRFSFGNTRRNIPRAWAWWGAKDPLVLEAPDLQMPIADLMEEYASMRVSEALEQVEELLAHGYGEPKIAEKVRIIKNGVPR